jgi:hypothetical protein
MIIGAEGVCRRSRGAEILVDQSLNSRGNSKKHHVGPSMSTGPEPPKELRDDPLAA